jgi:hypothetical protein
MRTYSNNNCRFSSNLSSGDSLTWADASLIIGMSAAFSHYTVAFRSGVAVQHRASSLLDVTRHAVLACAFADEIRPPRGT